MPFPSCHQPDPLQPRHRHVIQVGRTPVELSCAEWSKVRAYASAESITLTDAYRALVVQGRIKEEKREERKEDETMAMPPVTPDDYLTTSGVELIHRERGKQLRMWGTHHDLHQHRKGDLADAAAYLAANKEGHPPSELGAQLANAHNPSDNTLRRLQHLVIAGALIAAEIDRIQLRRKVYGEHAAPAVDMVKEVK